MQGDDDKSFETKVSAETDSFVDSFESWKKCFFVTKVGQNFKLLVGRHSKVPTPRPTEVFLPKTLIMVKSKDQVWL